MASEHILRWCRAFLTSLRPEIERQDTDHDLFHGCWDWHSAVHGHWAAITAASLLGDQGQLDWLLARLGSESMKEEFDLLRRSPDFELPYGRAWLLRLMLAYESISEDLQHRKDTEEVACGLMDWLESSPPDTGWAEYDNPCWALAQLYQWSLHAENERRASRIRSLVREHCMSTDNHPVDDRIQGEFFSKWAVQCMLIGEVLGRDVLSQWLSGQFFRESHLQPVRRMLSSHHLGMNASRAWGFWTAYDATGEQGWLQAYKSQVDASTDLHERWKAERRAYTHWVPQFTLYALLLPIQHP
jgi:hypothetical protein